MRFLALILLTLTTITMWAVTDDSAGTANVPALDTCYRRGSLPTAPLEDRKLFIKHIRDSIDALPWDTTRDENYWKRAIVNGEWSFFTDKTVKKPFLLDLASRAYNFYTKAFNNYDTAYVVGIDKDFRVMIINNDWLDSYGGKIAHNDIKVFMNSNVNASVGAHFSYMGIGYTYMFDLDHIFGGDPTRHMKWEMSFATSRFSFEAFRSRNSGAVTISRFGNYNNGKLVKKKFDGLTRVSSGYDIYYFFNHRKYSQAAAYSYSKIQRRSAGSFIAGLLLTTQDVSIDFSSLPEDMIAILPDIDVNPEAKYRYHYRSYCVMGGYAYNWVFHRNWLFNVTMAPSIGLHHSYSDSVEGVRDMLALNLRGRLGLVHNTGTFFYGLQLILDAHFYHSKNHDFINSLEDLTLTVGVHF